MKHFVFFSTVRPRYKACVQDYYFIRGSLICEVYISRSDCNSKYYSKYYRIAVRTFVNYPGNFLSLKCTLVLALASSAIGRNQNSWSAYSDTSSFRDVLQGRSYEEAFGDSYDNLFNSGLTGDSYGVGGTSSASEERNPIRVIPARSDSDYGSVNAPRYQSPAVTVRSGQRVNTGSGYNSQSSQSTYTGSSKSRKIAKSGLASGGQAYGGQSLTSKPAYGTTARKTTQQRDDAYGSDGYGDDSGSGTGGSGHTNEIPDTGFQCLNRYYGYYADVSANCQVRHRFH